MSLAITLGQGVARPQGKALALGAPAELAEALRGLPQAVERWWAPVTWLRDYRLAANWQSSSAAAVDVDFNFKEKTQWTRSRPDLVRAPTAEEAAALAAVAMPGSYFHPTPGGCRVVFAYAEPCTDRTLAIAANVGAGALVAAALGELPYHVDEPCLGDLGRLFFTPNAIAKGVARAAELVELRAQPYTPAELAAHVVAPVAPVVPVARGGSVQGAIERWNAAHAESWPKAAGDCPICGHRGCFGQMPEDPARWYCFSSQHSGGGIRGANGWHGDALDVDAALRGLTTTQVLIDDGYLEPRARPVAPVRAAQPDETAVTSIDRGRRAYRNNSYLTAVQIIETNDRDVLGVGARLEYDEMAGRVMLNRVPLKDSDETIVRSEIERRHVGGVDDHGNQKGLKISLSDVRQAIAQVAHQRPYHPVREYLSGLAWDGVARLDAVAEDVLGAERTVLNQAMVRRFMISAVARAMQPGCKVDTVLILVGHQGGGKSSFFGVLAGDWFVDTAMDIANTKSLQVLRRAWLFEWAELEVVRRARDINAVKSFVTSRVDSYVPQYGHNPVDVPRSFVIVGSTNSDEFLVDDENRRFWPLRVMTIDLAALREQRDQLWAEAVSLYQAWVAAGADVATTPWVLTAEEAAPLVAVHAEHRTSDVWDPIVITWAERQLSSFTTADALEHAIGKPRGQWSKADEMRVAAGLKRGGWNLDSRKPKGRSKAWSK